MKKINSIMLAACVAALGFFSSCGETDPASEMSATVTVMDQATGKVALEATLVKTADLYSVVTTAEGTNKTKISDTYKTQLSTLVNKGSVIFNLEPGSYLLVVTDKDAKEMERPFVITGGETPSLDFTKGTNTITEDGIYAYQQGTTIGGIIVSNLTTASVTVQLVSVDGTKKAAVELSDAGNSWLLKDGTSTNNAGLNVGAGMTSTDAAKILCAKKGGGAALIVDYTGTSAANMEGAEAVKFVKLTEEQMAMFQ